VILIIDNYDSFTYNLVQCIGNLGFEVNVARNNTISLEEVESFSPQAIIISPGPGTPNNSGVSLDIIKAFSKKIPILGVCLGHQSIGQFFGASIIHAPKPIHGKTSLIYHDSKGLFANISNPFIATRYHSLIVKQINIPLELAITAWTDRGIIMGCYHKNYPMLSGIQFHPESLWTTEGKQILSNFLEKSLV
jgi:anthranilate synthase component II